MAYKALYRAYRPQSFNEVAGQEHITKTLKNALRKDKLAHAYLFSGPRGTGKTSIAKIIAKTINCVNAPTDTPCNVCPNCIEITKGMVSDVIEIDAASNNGVDEIREIRDKVKFLPSTGRFKVYIIDEVHMLTKGAFNALLKTLEEPPKHVIFILATTEPHKVIATIHSRCQRFDFRSISNKEMIERMKLIIEEEKINVDEDALEIIAENAEGGMRDALSLLDQSISYANDNVTSDDIHTVTGTVSTDFIIELVEGIINKDVIKTLNTYEKMLEEGKETQRILVNVISFLRDLLIYKNIGNNQENKFIFKNNKFIELSKNIINKKLFEMINEISLSEYTMKRSNNKKVLFEMMLIKLIENEKEILRQPAKIIKHKEVEKQPRIQKKEIVKKVEQEVIHKEIIKQPTKEVSKKVLESTKTYDIRFIEGILIAADKRRKEQLINNWYKITNITTIELLNTAKYLDEFTKVVAYSNRKIILTASDASICNKAMRRDFQDKAKQVLKETFNADFEYLVIPIDLWNGIIKEFMVEWKSGNKNPKLSEITYEGLMDEADVIQTSPKKEDTDIVKNAKEHFGDIVEIKK